MEFKNAGFNLKKELITFSPLTLVVIVSIVENNISSPQPGNCSKKKNELIHNLCIHQMKYKPRKFSIVQRKRL